MAVLAERDRLGADLPGIERWRFELLVRWLLYFIFGGIPHRQH